MPLKIHSVEARKPHPAAMQDHVANSLGDFRTPPLNLHHRTLTGHKGSTESLQESGIHHGAMHCGLQFDQFPNKAVLVRAVAPQVRKTEELADAYEGYSG